MARNTQYQGDSIYDDYLGTSGPRSSTATSSGSGGTSYLSAAQPPVPRVVVGRSNATSMADTASVYTEGTSPYERWSLEQGLMAMDSHALQIPPVETTPSCTALPTSSDSVRHSLSSRTSSDATLQPKHGEAMARGEGSSQSAPSLVPNQNVRRHFSRPFRPEMASNKSPEPSSTLPTIAIQRLSGSSPEVYQGTDNDSPSEMRFAVNRESTYSQESARRSTTGHLRRRSAPIGKAVDDEDAFAGDNDRDSMHSVKKALAARHMHNISLPRMSIADSEPAMAEKPAAFNPNRPFSQSNTYPFSTSANAFGTARTLNHKPSSRFSEDEKGAPTPGLNYLHMSSDNDLQASTWNLFGRGPNTDKVWVQGTGGAIPMSRQEIKQAVAGKRRRRWFIILMVLLAVAVLGGAGAGVGIWRMNVSKQNSAGSHALSDSAVTATIGASAAAPSASNAANAAVGNNGVNEISSAVNAPVRTVTNVSAGAGGAGGYYSMVALGGSYADNGHWRSDAYKWTLQTGQYSGGRSSDGPVYTEYLSSLVGPKANQSAILFDYAYSGASTNNSVTTYSIPDMPQQVSTYLGDLAGGNATIAATAGKKTLITVWAGMEEIVTIWQAAISANPGNPEPYAIGLVQRMLSSMSTCLNWLIPDKATSDARPDFALLSLPQGDLLPEASGLGSGNAFYIAVLKNMTLAFNNGLSQVATNLNRSTVHIMSIQGLFNAVHTSPAPYGLQNANSACTTDKCNDASKYMWFDGLNPTTAMHKLVANRVAATILNS